jgi:LysM repeat protein
VEFIGLSPKGEPGPLTEGDLFTVPAEIKSLEDLAVRLRIPWADLTKANTISDADFAPDKRKADLQAHMPGVRQHLVVADVAPNAADTKVETPAMIAKMNGVTVEDLNRANPGRDWTTLAEGDRVLIPRH